MFGKKKKENKIESSNPLQELLQKFEILEAEVMEDDVAAPVGTLVIEDESDSENLIKTDTDIDETKNLDKVADDKGENNIDESEKEIQPSPSNMMPEQIVEQAITEENTKPIDNGFKTVTDEEGNVTYFDEDGNEVYLDEDGNQYFFDEEGNTFYIDEDGVAFYYDEDGNPFYYDENGNPHYYDSDVDNSEVSNENDNTDIVADESAKENAETVIQENVEQQNVVEQDIDEIQPLNSLDAVEEDSQIEQNESLTVDTQESILEQDANCTTLQKDDVRPSNEIKQDVSNSEDEDEKATFTEIEENKESDEVVNPEGNLEVIDETGIKEVNYVSDENQNVVETQTENETLTQAEPKQEEVEVKQNETVENAESQEPTGIEEDKTNVVEKDAENASEEKSQQNSQLAQLPILLDMILEQKASREIKIKVASMVLNIYNKFKDDPKNRKYVVSCMEKIQDALKQD